jgi:predicted nucleic acid-binding protein
VLRVTLDSKIYISALKFGGKPLHILTMAGKGHVEIAVSEVILHEVLRVLGDKFEWPSAAARQRSVRCVNCASSLHRRKH